MNSSFAYKGMDKSRPIRPSRTRGVWPTAPKILSNTRFSEDTCKPILSPFIYILDYTRAKRNHPSLNGEILSILEQATSLPPIDVQETLERARKALN
jgi:hypothetical protein